MGNKLKITEAHVDRIIEKSTTEDIKVGKKTTVVCITLPNGFEMVESSSCVHPDNYDHHLGVEICMKRLKDKIWHVEGYRLQNDKYLSDLNKDLTSGGYV